MGTNTLSPYGGSAGERIMFVNRSGKRSMEKVALHLDLKENRNGVSRASEECGSKRRSGNHEASMAGNGFCPKCMLQGSLRTRRWLGKDDRGSLEDQGCSLTLIW